METILVGEKEAKEYVDEAKKIFEGSDELIIKGKGRDTVKAVDVAELLKEDGCKTKNINISTEESENRRISVIEITIQK